MSSSTSLGTGSAHSTHPRSGADAASPPSDRKRAWASRAVHEITLTSGERVKIRIPDMGALVAADAIPNSLRKVVIEKVASDLNEVLATPQPGETMDGRPRTTPAEIEEAMKAGAELNDWLVTQMLVDPPMTVEDMAPGSPTRPPEEDIQLLVEIGRRERDTDARGVRLGVEPLDRLERFRHHHKCPEGCEACERYGREISTRGLGRL